ncbi:DedA family protein [Sinomonas sp. JGH33]|uniref:DedA family protein n=1 Tax=Sinomonas terricola TaxID=3110330 RepID=A0ABU5TCA5_9MICC|nr:DedA family protein [Sinomonas sp. JGH33]MEA5456696.1 DedA family protein [Sinomonas sp. JGH33]
MSAIVDAILSVPPLLAYVLVFVFVFAEDAIFVGFVIPGETAAVLGGVMASQGHADGPFIWLMVPIVVVAAIIGDTVGYEIGKHLGSRLLGFRIFDRHRKKLEDAQAFLRRRGGWAVFLGRFVAFFRAMMPALAGASLMPYRRFVAFNALGGLVWGAGFTLLGYLAGASYEVVAKAAGRDIAAVVLVVAAIAFIVWRVRKGRVERREERAYGVSHPSEPGPQAEN